MHTLGVPGIGKVASSSQKAILRSAWPDATVRQAYRKAERLANREAREQQNINERQGLRAEAEELQSAKK